MNLFRETIIHYVRYAEVVPAYMLGTLRDFIIWWMVHTYTIQRDQRETITIKIKTIKITISSKSPPRYLWYRWILCRWRQARQRWRHYISYTQLEPSIAKIVCDNRKKIQRWRYVCQSLRCLYGSHWRAKMHLYRRWGSTTEVKMKKIKQTKIDRIRIGISKEKQYTIR